LVKLSEAERQRYARQLIIKNWGEATQEKLKQSTIAIIGIGGLGSPVSLYAAAVGIGTIKIIDEDVVDLTNLNRQIIHFTPNISKKKVESAHAKLTALNPDIKIEPFSIKLTKDNIQGIIKGCNIVLDCLDNFQTRFLLNETCIKLGIPYVHAAVYAFEGRVLTIIPGKGPCLQCFYPKVPKAIKPFPVVGAAVGITASIEITEAIKVLTGIGNPLVGRLLIIDGENMKFDTIEIKQDPQCPICGKVSGKK
jgi:molybdopterin/thiamine biosynthesis adenylyltransferase